MIFPPFPGFGRVCLAAMKPRRFAGATSSSFSSSCVSPAGKTQFTRFSRTTAHSVCRSVVNRQLEAAKKLPSEDVAVLCRFCILLIRAGRFIVFSRPLCNVVSMEQSGGKIHFLSRHRTTLLFDDGRCRGFPTLPAGAVAGGVVCVHSRGYERTELPLLRTPANRRHRGNCLSH